MLSAEERSFYETGHDQFGNLVSAVEADRIKRAVREKLRRFNEDITFLQASGQLPLIYAVNLYPGVLNHEEKLFLKTGKRLDGGDPTPMYQEFLNTDILKKYLLMRQQIKMVAKSPHINWDRLKEELAKHSQREDSAARADFKSNKVVEVESDAESSGEEIP